jgi:RNA polymerase sigma-70 factor (ECF subfamily)
MRADIERIWQASSGDIRRFIRARVVDEMAAEDILQDVFVKAWTRSDTLRDKSKIEAWLYQIARHAIIDHHRRRRPNVELDESLAAEELPEDGLERDLAEGLPRLIEQLPEAFHNALVMSEIDGIPQNEVARRLGISLSGAKSRVQRARAKIKEMLDACCEFEFDRLGRVISYKPKCDPQTCELACC